MQRSCAADNHFGSQFAIAIHQQPPYSGARSKPMFSTTKSIWIGHQNFPGQERKNTGFSGFTAIEFRLEPGYLLAESFSRRSRHPKRPADL
jgi:hypothetical protein